MTIFETHSLEAGMDDYVIKPIHEAKLQLTLEHAVASPARARPPSDSAAPGIDSAANGKPSSFSEQTIVVDSPANAPKPLRILVAEDDVINRSLMLLILSRP